MVVGVVSHFVSLQVVLALSSDLSCDSFDLDNRVNNRKIINRDLLNPQN